jgi:fibro-slime domain-containing protein
MSDAIVLKAKVRDFKPLKNPDGSVNSDGHPDFQNGKANSQGLFLGLVKPVLGTDRKPQYAPDGSTKSSTGADRFLQWYNAPVTTVHEIQLKPLPGNPGVYSYQNDRFFPLDDPAFLQAHPEFAAEQKWEERLDDAQGRRPSGILRNFHFTLEINTTFTYTGTERFTFRGDDDLWVFIDSKLVIDLGGVHSPLERTIDLSLSNSKNRATPADKKLDILVTDLHVGDDVAPERRLQSTEQLVLEVGKDYTLDLFFAERHTGGCRFRVDTSMLLVSPPIVSIAATDPTASEQGLEPGEFTISLKEPINKDIQVIYQVSGTATPGSDYQPLSGSVTIPSGQTTAKIPVVPIDDAEIEAPETVIATLQPSADYQFGESTATITIHSEDVVIPVVTIVATDPVASEPNDPGEFTVSLNVPAPTSFSVPFTALGTATPGADYHYLSGVVHFAQGQTSAKILVIPVNDTEIEAPETVVVTLQGGHGYTLGNPSTATVTIYSEDVVIPVVTIAATDPVASEANDPGEFTVSLNVPAPTNFSVPFTALGTATPGADYHYLSGVVQFAQGQTTAKIPVIPINDAQIEAPETVVVTLQAGQGYALGNPTAATVTIHSEDVVIPVVTIAATDPVASEANDPGEFTVSLNVPAPTNFSVPFTALGTATPGADYHYLSGVVQFAQGQTTAKIPVIPINDAQIEAPETVVVTLQAGQGYALGNPTAATVTIHSEDVALPVCSVKATRYARRPTTGVDAIPGEFTVSLSQTSAQPLTVLYTIAAVPPPNTVAAPGIDYQPLSGSVQIPANQTMVKIPVMPLPITRGNMRPNNMTVTIALQVGAGYALGSTTDTVLVLLSTSPVPGPR